jgi:CRP/FNR family transcriptional regulator, anaerobic regulatory protein
MVTKNQVYCENCPTSCFMKVITDPETVKAIQDKKVINIYKKGQQIIFEGMPVNTISFIYSGKVKVFKSGDYGRQQILRFSRKGDILGHRSINSAYYPISATALEDTTICVFPYKFFNDLLRSKQLLTYNLLMFFADELLNSEIRERNLAQMNVREKIADTLLYLNKQYSTDKDNFIDIYLSRQDLGDFAGTTKEQVSKTLSEFRKDGIIDLIGKKVTLKNIPALESISFCNSPYGYK